jgi:D-arabinose 1-dehydrogenase-like Zn-dependent alcohol dehydrogenase
VLDVFVLERDFDLEHDDRTDRLALVHQIEPLVDVLKLEEINKGFDLMHEGKSIRSVVVF